MIWLAWLLFSRTRESGNNSEPPVLISRPLIPTCPSLRPLSDVSGLEKAKGKGIGHLSFGSESRTQALPLFSFFTRLFSNSSRSILPSVFSFQQEAGGARQRDCVVGLTQ